MGWIARRDTLWNAGLLSVCLLLGVASLEIAARYLQLAPVVYRLNPDASESAYRFSDNPVLGYEMKPGFRDDTADLHQSFPSINSHGFRDIERRFERQTGVSRVIVLGDSVIAGVGIRQIEDLIPAQLEKNLPAGRYEVLNLGIAGYCTYGEIELLATRGLKYQPEQVILLFVENDYVSGNFLFGEYTIERPVVAEYLFLHSALFRWASLRWDWFHFAALVQGHETESERGIRLARYSYRRFTEVLGEGETSAFRGLERLRQLADEHGFSVTVAIWPRFYPDFIAEGDHDLVEGEIAVARISRELGFTVIRLSETFRADLEREKSNAGGSVNALDLYTLSRADPMHPNRRGAAVAARALAVAITGRGSITP